MGIENMRRWPMYAVFAVSVLLMVSLFNSWSLETELRAKLQAMVTQMHECTRQSATCMEESLTLLEQRDTYLGKATELGQRETELRSNLTEYVSKLMKSEIQVNHTRDDVDLCKTELQSLKFLQVSKSAMLETLRLEKDTMSSQLAERKQKIEELEKEVEKLKSALTTKSVPVPSLAGKVTPAAEPPKVDPLLKPQNELAIGNDAKEELEEGNMDFDQQINRNVVNQSSPKVSPAAQHSQKMAIPEPEPQNSVNGPAFDNDAKEEIEDINGIIAGDFDQTK